MTIDRNKIPVLAGLLFGLLALVGSLGPWASVWFVTVGGMDGDGQFSAALALVVIGALGWHLYSGAVSRKPLWLATVAFVLIAIIGIYDWWNISTLVDDDGDELSVLVRVGWGLQMVAFAGVAGLVASIVALRDLRGMDADVEVDEPASEIALN